MRYPSHSGHMACILPALVIITLAVPPERSVGPSVPVVRDPGAPTRMALPFEEEAPLQLSYGRDILVVDDNQTNLIAIEAALAPLGRHMVMAHSGIEALGRLLEQDFALIILDVAMPGMDGFETAKLVRSRERNRATPIIFVTGHAWENDAVIRGYELGAFDFLMKPIRPEVLRAKATVFVQLQERTIELAIKADELRFAQAQTHERELQSQRRRFEAEVMERQMQQLAETDRRKDEFLAILAHELRNPLQPLQTAVEVLEHDPDKPVPVADPADRPAPGPAHHAAGRRPARRRPVHRRQARPAPRAGRDRRGRRGGAGVVQDGDRRPQAPHRAPHARRVRAGQRRSRCA